MVDRFRLLCVVFPHFALFVWFIPLPLKIVLNVTIPHSLRTAGLN